MFNFKKKDLLDNKDLNSLKKDDIFKELNKAYKNEVSIKNEINISLCLFIISIILLIIGIIFIPIATITTRKETYFNFNSLEAYIVYLGLGLGLILLIFSIIIFIIYYRYLKINQKMIKDIQNKL